MCEPCFKFKGTVNAYTFADFGFVYARSLCVLVWHALDFWFITNLNRCALIHCRLEQAENKAAALANVPDRNSFDAKWRKDADAQPLFYKPWAERVDVKLTGVPTHRPRVIERINKVYDEHCVKSGEKLSDAELVRKRKYAAVDYSQQDRRKRIGASLPTMLTTTRYYSYHHDCELLPEDHFRLLGHPPANLIGLTPKEIRSLAGDAMSAPTMVLAAAALILCADLVDFWEKDVG